MSKYEEFDEPQMRITRSSQSAFHLLAEQIIPLTEGTPRRIVRQPFSRPEPP